MRRIKKGFSLAEVATAMAVVGIVASIIIPQTAKTLQKHSIYLKKIENVFKNRCNFG